MPTRDFCKNTEEIPLTLVGGTDEEVGILSDLGSYSGILLTIVNVSGAALTNCKMQVRNFDGAGWENYLTGTDWLAVDNRAQMSWTGDVSPSAVAPGETAVAKITPDDFVNFKQARFLVDGTAGTNIIFQAEPVRAQNSR